MTLEISRVVGVKLDEQSLKHHQGVIRLYLTSVYHIIQILTGHSILTIREEKEFLCLFIVL
jgi:hypothetical protein